MPLDLGCFSLCCDACVAVALLFPPPLDVAMAAACVPACRAACDTDTLVAGGSSPVPLTGAGDNGTCNDPSQPGPVDPSDLEPLLQTCS